MFLDNRLPKLDKITQLILADDKVALESAEWCQKRLINLINVFEKNLPPDMQVRVQFGRRLFKIENIGFWEPDVIVFDAVLDDDSHVQLIQHKSQLNLLLKSVKRNEDKTKPRRPVGFLTLPTLTKNYPDESHEQPKQV